MRDLKIASIIVTYNRKKLLIENIKMLLKQTYKSDIIIIDNNSTDDTYEYLSKNLIFENKNVIYMNTNKNLGGAGGFEFGVRMAFEKGYDALWMMDDDGRPLRDDTLQLLIEEYSKNINKNKMLFINSLVINEENKLSFRFKEGINNLDESKLIEERIVYNHVNPFNGTLISKDLISKIGYPNKDFFIKGDENEYLLRAKKEGALVFTVLDSLYFHPKEPSKIITILGRKLWITDEVFWKEYYTSRNYTYINKNYKTINELIKFIIKRFINIFYYSDYRLKKAYYSIKGIIHGIYGNLGKVVSP